MSSTAKFPLIKIVADISNVNEVSLLGTADLAYWTDRLRPAALEPTPLQGRAQILVIAAQLKFMGLHFNEISFSILCRSTKTTNAADPLGQVEAQDGSFLLRAFNSNRFFAWSERVFFSTPYYYADCRVETNVPASIELMQNDKLCFAAKMNMDENSRDAIRNTEEGWDGPVFLPNLKSRRDSNNLGSQDVQKFFVAKILGPTQVFLFSEADKVEINISTDMPFLKELVYSNFAGHQWHIRTGARHAKSKTYKRKT
jgi:hypothetical protein